MKIITSNKEWDACGVKKYFVRNICKVILKTEAAELMAIHWIIHQQTLNEKSAPISEVINVVVRMVNLIQKSTFSYCQVKKFFVEIESKLSKIFCAIVKPVDSAEKIS